MTQRTYSPKTPEKMPSWLSYAPWLIVLGSAALAVFLTVINFTDFKRESLAATVVFREKGQSLIRSFEAALVAGYGFSWTEEELQSLLNEQARQDDIYFLAITDSTGAVIASSKPDLVGTNLLPSNEMESLKSGPYPQGCVQEYPIKISSEESLRQIRVFQVYRNLFLPPAGRFSGAMPPPPPDSLDYATSKRHKMDGMMHDAPAFFPFRRHQMPDPQKALTMFVAYDAAALIRAQELDSKRNIFQMLILVFLGFVGYISFFVVRAYQRSYQAVEVGKAYTDSLVSTLPLGLLSLNTYHQILSLNPAGAVITGKEEEEIQDKTVEEALPQLSEYLEDFAETIADKRVLCNFGGDAPIPLQLTCFPIYSTAQEKIGYAVLFRDMREIQKLEDQLHRQERLAALGNMAAGIAHEIRNPLSAIKGLARFFEESSPKESDEAKLASVMTQEVQRVDKVVGDLLELAKPDSLSITEFSLIDMLAGLRGLLQSSLEQNHVVLEEHIQDSAQIVRLDFDRIRQVLLNIFLNSLQAMPCGGQLTFSAEKNRDILSIEIVDSGEGIAESDLQNIFRPYYTTKAKGTGLGLAMAQKIVEAHGGHISIQSKEKEGTSVFISIPQSNPQRIQ